MGWIRPAANGVPFLGCRSWMWVVCGKWWSEEGDQPLFWGRRWLLVCGYGRYGGYGGFWLRNLWVFMRCNALLFVCCGSDRGGAGRGRQGREGRVSGGRESGLEKFYCVFFFFFFCFGFGFVFLFYYYFFNIVLTWKIVEASKVSVLYIYIDDMFTIFSQYFYNKF